MVTLRTDGPVHRQQNGGPHVKRDPPSETVSVAPELSSGADRRQKLGLLFFSETGTGQHIWSETWPTSGL